MMRLVLLLFLLPSIAISQVRLGRLEIKAGESYRLEKGDILVVDTLVMGDSAKLFLNRNAIDNFLHAKVLTAGRGASILGFGTTGNRGKDGVKGLSPSGPCLDGGAGRGGTGGTHGENGNNLFLYTGQLNINGSLVVDLSGGDGGDGGNGGIGGDGGQATRVCVGGTGGIGGNGGTGGNGGNGGMFTITCKSCGYLRTWLGDKIVVRNFGGYAGVGGNGGSGGSPGLGVYGDTSKDGKFGTKGKRGADGEAGKQGAINFELN